MKPDGWHASHSPNTRKVPLHTKAEVALKVMHDIIYNFNPCNN